MNRARKERLQQMREARKAQQHVPSWDDTLRRLYYEEMSRVKAKRQRLDESMTRGTPIGIWVPDDAGGGGRGREKTPWESLRKGRTQQVDGRHRGRNTGAWIANESWEMAWVTDGPGNDWR